MSSTIHRRAMATRWARQLGCAPSAVTKARRNRNIPPAPTHTHSPTGPDAQRIDWDKQPLGEMTDTDLSQRLMVSPTTVRRQRINREIPAYAKPEEKTSTWDSIASKLESNPNVPEVAAALGVNPTGVYRALRDRGLITEPSQPRERYKHVDWGSLDWTKTNTTLARETGIGRMSIQRHRPPAR